MSAEDCLRGWTLKVYVRKSRPGNLKCYYDPNNKRYRSAGEVERYLVRCNTAVPLDLLDKLNSLPLRPDDAAGPAVVSYVKATLAGRDQFAQTPPELFDLIAKRFGYTDLFDPCPANPEFNGLDVSWKQVNYVNPPYRKVEVWLRKAIAEHALGKTVLLLLPSRTSPRWFHQFVMKAHVVLFLLGGIRFVNYTGRAPFGVMLVYLDGRQSLLSSPHTPRFESCAIQRESKFDNHGCLASNADLY